ncbi:MAG: c-type cytochrome domain-containing protein [Planctomycetia bacterium]
MSYVNWTGESSAFGQSAVEQGCGCDGNPRYFQVATESRSVWGRRVLDNAAFSKHNRETLRRRRTCLYGMPLSPHEACQSQPVDLADADDFMTSVAEVCLPPGILMLIRSLICTVFLSTLFCHPLFAIGDNVRDIAESGVIEFNRDIRPILSDNCFFCHGPDRNKREADLRLDTQEGLHGADGSGGAIVSGRPEDSLMIQRVVSGDPEKLMPPASSGAFKA